MLEIDTDEKVIKQLKWNKNIMVKFKEDCQKISK